ncbi:hypothetical protein WA026_014065 [Henosepilachna vigintioctopunctata]|uniref:Reverse transcriptase domain-containing protein n=1 Tax=Henosepilachna vigintioctopunctata TaxID=420089 RepID=A0AAW1TYK5_9CUCU
MKIRTSGVDLDYRLRDINIKYDTYIANLLGIVDDLTPNIEIEIRCSNKSWFNADILNRIKLRDNKFREFKFTKDEHSLAEYKRERNNVVDMIRRAKCNYYEQCIDENKNDAKLMWRTLKKLTSSKQTEIFTEIIFENITYTEEKVICTQFNKYYIDSINKILSTINSSISQDDIICETKNCNVKFEVFELITEVKLLETIMALANKSSPDEINMLFIKLNFYELKKLLMHLINCSLESAIVPKKMKVSTIIPIRKIKNSKNAEDFRPVNMLPAHAKILERIVYDQLVKHISINNILSKYQSGFRKNYSCETAFQYTLHNWKTSVDKNFCTIVVFLDLKRAFETVNREILLFKLEKYGLKGTVLNWFRSYLSERQQNVKCGYSFSENMSVESGVPQGSVLGPLLFVLYINDIENIVKNCKIHLFADDTIIYITSSESNIIDKLQEDIDRLVIWLNSNKLKLNVQKTKAMILGKRNITEKILGDLDRINLKINNDKIEIIETIKYLGIIVDSKLKFENHREYVCRKISQKLGVLYRCSKYLTCWARKTVYNIIILPHYLFASTILYLSNIDGIKRLQLLQNRAMRIILKRNRYAGIDNMLQDLNWINIEKFLEMQALIFIYKIKTGIMPDYFDEILVPFQKVHNYDTRNKMGFMLQQAASSAAHNSVFVKGVVKYNKLPISIKTATFTQFRKKLREYYNECDY